MRGLNWCSSRILQIHEIFIFSLVVVVFVSVVILLRCKNALCSFVSIKEINVPLCMSNVYVRQYEVCFSFLCFLLRASLTIQLNSPMKMFRKLVECAVVISTLFLCVFQCTPSLVILIVFSSYKRAYIHMDCVRFLCYHLHLFVVSSPNAIVFLFIFCASFTRLKQLVEGATSDLPCILYDTKILYWPIKLKEALIENGNGKFENSPFTLKLPTQTNKHTDSG